VLRRWVYHYMTSQQRPKAYVAANRDRQGAPHTVKEAFTQPSAAIHSHLQHNVP